MSISIPVQNATPFKQTLPQPYAIGRCRPMSGEPKALKIVIDWSLYPSNLVGFNLRQGINGQGLLDRIAAIRIDNIGNTAQVIALFNDTGDAILCEQNAKVTDQVLTGDLIFTVFCNAGTSTAPTSTTIILTNVDMMPSDLLDDPIVPSGMLQSSVTPGVSVFSVPALGDNVQSALVNLTVAGGITNLFATPRASGRCIITNIFAFAFGVYTDQNGPVAIQVRLEDISPVPVTNTDYLFQWYARPTMDDYTGKIIKELIGLYRPISALNTIQLRNVAAIASGFLQVDIHWTYANGPF